MNISDPVTLLTPPVRHPLYQGSVQADLTLHASLCGIGLLPLITGLLLLAAPNQGDAPFFLLMALVPLTVSMVASSATLRLWGRTPTNWEALMALAVSVPLIGVALISVLGGLWTVHMRGDALPLAGGLAVLFAQHLYRLLQGWMTHRSRRHLPKSRAHTRAKRKEGPVFSGCLRRRSPHPPGRGE